jgi:hypothetical protein
MIQALLRALRDCMEGALRPTCRISYINPKTGATVTYRWDKPEELKELKEQIEKLLNKESKP